MKTAPTAVRASPLREALLANPYQRTWGARGEPPLPVHPVTLNSLLYGILPFGPPYLFRQATERAVDSAADLRWGPVPRRARTTPRCAGRSRKRATREMPPLLGFVGSNRRSG